MPEELGKIEKPPVEDFKNGRKLFFVPLVMSGKDLPSEAMEKFDRYWEQVESQIANLEAKIGPANHIFHELIPDGGEEGLKTLKQLNIRSLQIIQNRVEKGAIFEATESNEILAELTDWSRCLSLGLQSQKVFSTIYQFYSEASQKRNEYIAKNINDTLKENESAIFVMEEGHHVQFSQDIRVFYVAPPALDEIKRWMRDYEAKLKEQPIHEAESAEEKTVNPDQDKIV